MEYTNSPEFWAGFWAGFNLAILAYVLGKFLFFVIRFLRPDRILMTIFPSLDNKRDEKTRKIKAAKLLAKHGIIVYRYSYHPCLNNLNEPSNILNDNGKLDFELSDAWFEFAGEMDSYIFLNEKKRDARYAV